MSQTVSHSISEHFSSVFKILLCSIFLSGTIWALPPAEDALPYPGFIGVGGSVSQVKEDPAYLLNFTASNRVSSFLFLGIDYNVQLNTKSYVHQGKKFSLGHSLFGAHLNFPLIEKAKWGMSVPVYLQLGILTSIFSTSEDGEGVDYFFAPAAGVEAYYRLTSNISIALNGTWLQAIGIEENGLEDSDFSRPTLNVQFRWTP